MNNNKQRKENRLHLVMVYLCSFYHQMDHVHFDLRQMDQRFLMGNYYRIHHQNHQSHCFHQMLLQMYLF